MIIQVTPPTTEIETFPGTESIPCSSFDDKLFAVYLSGASHGGYPGIIVYLPNTHLNMFTSFIPGSGVYIIKAKESFEIITN